MLLSGIYLMFYLSGIILYLLGIFILLECLLLVVIQGLRCATGSEISSIIGLAV